MKKFIFSKEIKNVLLLITFATILIAEGCYEIQNIIQQATVHPNIPFEVKINVKTDNSYEPTDFVPAYGFIGILLPEGWKVKDTLNYTVLSGNPNQTGVFIRNTEVAFFMKFKKGMPPAGYYWWGAKSNNIISLGHNQTGFVNITIIPNDKIGKYNMKYFLGDDTDWNKQVTGELFGIVVESDFLPIENSTVHSENIKNSDELKVYPNPATDKVTFSWNTNYDKFNLKLYQASGSCLIDREITSQETVNIQNLPEGIYIYKLSNRNEILKTGKLLVK